MAINVHGQVTIPKNIQRARDWKAGTPISVIQSDDSSSILRARQMPQPKPELHFAALNPASDAYELELQVQAGTLLRLAEGIYAPLMPENELAALVRRQWQQVAGAIAPGGVLSHLSAMKGGVLESGVLVLSHPTHPEGEVVLPGLRLFIVSGPGPLAGDMPLGTSGLHFAGRARMLLENLDRSGIVPASASDAETHLVTLLIASDGWALKVLLGQAGAIALSLRAEQALRELHAIICALLGKRPHSTLRTVAGRAAAQGMPIDTARLELFLVLAEHLRSKSLPRIDAPPRLATLHAAFIEAYFSNFVEGIKFNIEEARGIVLSGQVDERRPKDSHDLLGVFRLASAAPYRNSPPTPGPQFLDDLAQWHAEMMEMRPEANPGLPKVDANYAGTTRFVDPAFVRGTLAEGSKLADDIPEGLARAIFYALLISEVHAFVDGNGRLCRLVMNAELSRSGCNRIIIPTLFHPQYVDCARALTRTQSPGGFIRCLAKMAQWSSQFDYSDLDKLIPMLKTTNAFEESPADYRLMNTDGSVAA